MNGKTNNKLWIVITIILSMFVIVLSVFVIMFLKNDSITNSNMSKVANSTTHNETSTIAQKSTTVTRQELNTILSKLDVSVISATIIEGDDRYPLLYPDMLQATISNNSDDDIKSIIIQFVGWDKNNLPVRLKTYMSTDEASYVTECTDADANIPSGNTYGEDFGWKLDGNIEASYVKAIVLGYKTFDGVTYINPYVDLFYNMYKDGVKNVDDLSVTIKDDVDLNQSSFLTSEEAGVKIY